LIRLSLHDVASLTSISTRSLPGTPNWALDRWVLACLLPNPDKSMKYPSQKRLAHALEEGRKQHGSEV
jgi:hypothetical protein